MSFDAGFLLGLSMGGGGGGGGSEYVNNDPDYALYKAMPEPHANQITILLRIADGTSQRYVTVHYDSNKYDDVSDYDEGTIDWGDGTIEGIGKMWGGEHAYSISGDYIITVTDNSGGRIESVCCTRQRNYGYPIALKVGTSLVYDDGLGSKYIGSSSNFKYIQFAGDYIWGNGVCINGASILYRLDFLSDVKPKKLVNNLFTGCYVLDFENLMPLFSEVTEVGGYAFNSCYGLRKLSLPQCKKIGDNAIRSCYGLTDVDLPLCTTMGSGALSTNYALKKVTLSKDCSYGKNALQSCLSLIPTPNGIYPSY